MACNFHAAHYQLLLSLTPQKHVKLANAVIAGMEVRLSIQHDKSPIRMLDIGSGQGSLATPLISAFCTLCRQSGRNAQIDLIEPDYEMRVLLADALSEPQIRGLMPPPVFLEETFQRAIASGRLQFNEYTFVLASHVFYYLDRWGDCLRQILNLVCRSGVACIVLKSKDTDLYRLREMLPWRRDAQSYLNQPLFAEDFESIASEVGHTYEVDELDYELFIPSSPASRPLSPTLEELFGFCFGIPNEHWSDDVREQLNSFLKQYSAVKQNVGLHHKEKLFWFSI